MPLGKPNLQWPAKIATSSALCLVGAAVGTGLYFANLSYVSTSRAGTCSRIAGECVGVSDDHAFVSPAQDTLMHLRNAIKAENDWVDKQNGSPVTVAFLGPLSDDNPNAITGGRVVHELEGAYIAQHQLNHGPLSSGQRRLKLTLANEGHGERHWKDVVDQLVDMTADDHAPLEAVIGLVLSQKETAQAALELSAKHIPVIGDIVTADGLDATGAVLPKMDLGPQRPIDYLARVAIPNNVQIHAIADYIRSSRKDLHSAVMVTDVNGGDVYNTSLRSDFEKYLGDYWERGGRADDPFLSTGDFVQDISGAVRDFCGPNRADVVLFAGRANTLNQFISELQTFQTQQGQKCKAKPLTIVTGSDAAAFARGTARPADRSGHGSGSRFTILYSPLADPSILKVTNPRPFEEFQREFTTFFRAGDLDDGSAIDAHDAMMTAGSAIRETDPDSAGPPPTREDIRITLRQFQAGRQITGAVTLTNLDQNGNPKPNTPPVVLQVDHGGPAGS